ncbi:MAG: hypothetical protein CML37_01620 [Rhodobacteraceae bacterium]|nr:hypothetical protein [Paracoccaceae bacterium]
MGNTLTVDYLSVLNNKGSGLNITQIVDSLVDADTLPKKEMLTESQTTKQSEISAFAEVASELNSLKTDLSSLANSNKYVPTSANTALSLTVSDNATAKDFASDVRVVSLASQQTLEFAGSSPFTSQTAAISQGTLTLTLGSWNSDNTFSNKSPAVTHSVKVDSNNNTLQGLAASINALTDISASVLQTSSGVYSLVVKSAMGADNAIKIVAVDSGLNQFRADPTINTGTPTPRSVQKTAASDAELTVDGVTVKRTSNTVTNLFSGYSIDLKSTTTSAFRVSSSLDEESAYTNTKTLVDRLNLTRTYLSDILDKGADDGEAGALAHDPVMGAIAKEIRKLTEGGIIGFGANTKYLSELGISTKRDGTLSINEKTFKDALKNDTTSFDAIFNSSVTSDNSNLVMNKNLFSSPKPGSYAYALATYTDDEGASQTTGSLNGVHMSGGTDRSTGLTYYSATQGDAMGVNIIPYTTVSSATVYVGESMIDTMNSYLEQVLASSGDLERRKTVLNRDLSDINTNLLDIDTKVDTIRERYLEQYGAMESAVTSLKGTGEYLENMIKSWNSEDS